MKNLTMILILLFSLFTATTAVEWEEIKCDVKSTPSAVFRSGDTIYIGHYGIAKSTDGGKTFKKINKVVDGDREFDLADEGYKITRLEMNNEGYLLASVEGFGMLITKDAGETWSRTMQTKPEGFTISDLNSDSLRFKISYENDIFASRRYFQLNHSKDNGKNWERVVWKSKDTHSVSSVMYIKERQEFLFKIRSNEYIDKFVFYDPITERIRERKIEKFDKENNNEYASEYFIYQDDVYCYNHSFLDPKLAKYNSERQQWEDIANIGEVATELNIQNGKYPYYYNLVHYGDIWLFESDVRFIFTTNYKTYYLFSSDNGNTWQKFEMPIRGMFDCLAFRNQNNKFDTIDLQSNRYYFEKNTRKHIYNIENQELDEVNNYSAQVSPIENYRKKDNQQICLLYDEGEPIWTSDNGKWKHILGKHYAWPNFDGSAYALTKSTVCYYPNWNDLMAIPEDTLTIAHWLYNQTITEHYTDCVTNIFGNLMCLDKYSMYSSMYSSHYNETYIYERGREIMKLDRADYIGNITSDYKYCAIKMPNWNMMSESQKDSIASTTYKIIIGDNKGKIKEINTNAKVIPSYLKLDWEDQSLIFLHNGGIDISRNFGSSWDNVCKLPNSILGRWQGIHRTPIRLKNDLIYLKTNKLLLRSHDGNYWENILEGTSKAWIIDFEFDPDNYAYVYTTNGAFISSENMEDAIEAWKEDDIDFNFSVSSDKKTLQISGSDRINNVSVSESDLELKRISERNFDISNLAAQNYFLRVQLEDRKVVYKQLVLAAK